MTTHLHVPPPPLSEHVELIWHSESYVQPHPQERLLPTGSDDAGDLSGRRRSSGQRDLRRALGILPAGHLPAIHHDRRGLQAGRRVSVRQSAGGRAAQSVRAAGCGLGKGCGRGPGSIARREDPGGQVRHRRTGAGGAGSRPPGRTPRRPLRAEAVRRLRTVPFRRGRHGADRPELAAIHRDFSQPGRSHAEAVLPDPAVPDRYSPPSTTPATSIGPASP